mmetsp:Transcript_15556/g.31533  ORF Transcript_15556/g.31533 Transcript_15556/m.31533 type:complete len:112 (-) Transcript_15556:144-479(-)
MTTTTGTALLYIEAQLEFVEISLTMNSTFDNGEGRNFALSMSPCTFLSMEEHRGQSGFVYRASVDVDGAPASEHRTLVCDLRLRLIDPRHGEPRQVESTLPFVNFSSGLFQ